MEELKRRLEFDNSSVQIQVIRKLKSDIGKKKEKLGLIREATPQIAELSLLLEKCADKNNVCALACCDAITDMVLTGITDFEFTMRSLLNIVPSAKNLNGIIHAVTSMLNLQLAVCMNSGQHYVCPYSLRLPPHPFITILNNRPESWPQLIHEVYRLCHSENKSIKKNSIKILEPFLKFVLLEPHQSQQFHAVRASLHRILLQVVAEEDDSNMFNFLVKILPCFQINNTENLEITSQFLSEMLRIKSSNENDLSTLVRFGLSLCLQNITFGMDFTILARSIERILSTSKIGVEDGTNIVALASLVSRGPREYLDPLLNIANLLLTDMTINPIIVGMLALPALILVTTPPIQTGTRASQQTDQKIKTLLATVKKNLRDHQDKKEKWSCRFEFSITTEGYQCQEMADLAEKFWSDLNAAEIWLQNYQSCIPQMKAIPLNVTNMVASLFLISQKETLTDLALKTIVGIAKQDHCQAPNFLPLMICKLSMETSWDNKLKVLRCLPSIATHKVCVSPIMKTIQSLGSTPALRPLSLSLMVDLWKLQDRCFPHLLQMIAEYYNGNYDVQLARVRAVLDVCKIRPEQHGADMLGPLSDILNTFTKDEEAPIAAMALEGLYHLCEAEVIDIKSAWDVLSVKLNTDTRPTVVEKICDLFSLVPDHAVDTPEYQKFVLDTVQNLWLLSRSTNENVVQAAFQALSMFPADLFRMSHLPAMLIEDFVQQAELISSQQEEKTLTVDDVWPNIPGVVYIRLLKSIFSGSLKGFEAFLTSMVAKEVENLPRGIYHSSLRRQGAASNQGQTVGSIPSFLLAQYQKTKQPGLRPGLAAGLLFSYDPAVDVGRDGRPRKRYVMSHSKTFQQMFTTLLHEVPIQPSEWHRTLVIPQGWTSFMDRLFIAMLEGRTAEIELQVKREHITQSDAEDKQLAAWLWVRGEIVGMIKTASRGNPGMQSNSVYALAGLAVAINRYGTSLDKESLDAAEANTEYMSHSHWLTVVMDTIMCLNDVKHKPKGALLGLCQQRSADDKLPASTLAQASASVALSQIVPILISHDSSRMVPCIQLLCTRLPGTSEESPVLQFHGGLGLGMFLARIFEEHFSDVCGTKGMVEIWKTLDKFEDICLSSVDNRQGCLLGLAMAISALCEEGKTEARAHVSSIFDKLYGKFESSHNKDTAYQALAVCLSCVSGAAFSSNIVSQEQIDRVVDNLVKVNADYPQLSGVSLALGMLCYSISKTGHPSISEVKGQLYTKWMAAAHKQDEDSMVTVASLNGLIALVGSERSLIPIQRNASMLGADVNVGAIIKHAMDTIVKGDNLGIQSNCSWMLGHLYLSACAVAESRASVPPNYSYLPEHSFIRAIIDFLHEAAKLGPESVPVELVQIALTSLQEEVTRVLPPLNWAGLLTPLMRHNFGENIQRLCLQLAVNQSTTSPTAVMFLSSWLTAPLYSTLSISCKKALFKALSVVIKSVAPSVIKIFLEKGGTEILMSSDLDAKQEVLQGLHKALQVPDPPDSITSVLYQCLEILYNITITEQSLMCCFGKCFEEVPDNVFDKITEHDLLSDDKCFKGMFVRCYLVAKGRQPMAILNSCVDKAVNSHNISRDKNKMIQLLQNTLYQILQCKSEFTGTLQCVQWFLELLGHTRNISNGIIEVSKEVQMKEVLDLCCEVVSSALCIWTSTIAIPLLLINNNYFSHEFNHTEVSLVHSGLRCLSACLENLQSSPWDQLSANVIDWISLMIVNVQENSHKILKAGGLMTRHIQDFHKVAVWTKYVHEHL